MVEREESGDAGRGAAVHKLAALLFGSRTSLHSSEISKVWASGTLWAGAGVAGVAGRGEGRQGMHDGAERKRRLACLCATAESGLWSGKLYTRGWRGWGGAWGGAQGGVRGGARCGCGVGAAARLLPRA